MDYTEYTAVKNRFSATPNLCDLFKLLSIETWKRIEYAYLKSGVKVFEVTNNHPRPERQYIPLLLY